MIHSNPFLLFCSKYYLLPFPYYFPFQLKIIVFIIWKCIWRKSKNKNSIAFRTDALDLSWPKYAKISSKMFGEVFFDEIRVYKVYWELNKTPIIRKKSLGSTRNSYLLFSEDEMPFWGWASVKNKGKASERKGYLD